MTSHPEPSRPPAHRPVPVRSGAPVSKERARHRFLEWDDYRVDREWKRFEGTPLRDLYRELRERFLLRHGPGGDGRTLDVGPGPGRFTGVGSGPDDRIAVLEMSRAMLSRLRENAAGSAHPLDMIQGDAVYPPFRTDRFRRVVLLGNVLGFAEDDGPALLTRTSALVEPGGGLLVEFVAGTGERSRYLHRLPPGAIARLLAAPLRAIEPRVVREGFDPVRAERDGSSRFRRFTVPEVEGVLRSAGFAIREVLAVAPCLGNDASRLKEIRTAPKAWSRLLELEEAVGRRPERLRSAAALLLAAERTKSGPQPAPVRTIK